MLAKKKNKNKKINNDSDDSDNSEDSDNSDDSENSVVSDDSDDSDDKDDSNDSDNSDDINENNTGNNNKNNDSDSDDSDIIINKNNIKKEIIEDKKIIMINNEKKKEIIEDKKIIMINTDKKKEIIENKKYIFNNNDIHLNFNYEYYQLLNKDLKLTNEIEYINHFIKIGKYECRPYSKEHLYKYYNCDWTKFINDYKLIEIKSNEQALNYYLKNIKNNYKIYSKFDKKYFSIQFFKEYYNIKNTKVEDTKNEIEQLYEIFLMINDKDKIYFNYSNYFIYNLIDWKKFYENNNLNIENDNKVLYYYFINQFSNYKNNFNIDFNIDYLENMTEFNDLIFNDLDKFIKYLLFNIKQKDNTYFNNLLILNNYLTKFDKKYKIIDIPPLFEFNNNNKVINESLHFTFIIYSYNVENNLYNNLLSILYQNYTNWNIIYINNNSTDNTQTLLNKFIQDFDLNNQIRIIHNKEKKSETNLKYDIYQELNLNTICILLNGNNWLINDNVLIEANNKFIKTNNLLLYSGYNILNNNKIEDTISAYEYEDDIKNNILYRKHYYYEYDYLLFTPSNLLKQISKKYYFNNNWIDNSNNLIDFICLLELSGNQISTFHNIFYVVNKINNIKSQELIKNNKIILENYTRKLEIIQKYIPPIYNFNLDKISFTKTMDTLPFKNYFIYEKENANSIIDLYNYINTYTNYNHIFIINKYVNIHRNFDTIYKINNINLIDKDFIALGYNINQDIFDSLIKNPNNNNLLELSNKTGDNCLNDVYCYICSRKYREFIIKYYNSNNSTYVNFINNITSNNSENYIENNLLFFICNTNLFTIDSIK